MGVAMLLDLGPEQLGVLRRALEARVRDMHLRLGSDPGDEDFRREAMLSSQRSFSDRSGPWNGRLIAAHGLLVMWNLCPRKEKPKR